MTKKEIRQSTEPFLTGVARRIGYAAGSLAKVTHGFTDNDKSSTSSNPLPASGGEQSKSKPQTKTSSVAGGQGRPVKKRAPQRSKSSTGRSKSPTAGKKKGLAKRSSRTKSPE